MRELKSSQKNLHIPKAQLVAPSAQQNLKDNISGYLNQVEGSATALVEWQHSLHRKSAKVGSALKLSRAS